MAGRGDDHVVSGEVAVAPSLPVEHGVCQHRSATSLRGLARHFRSMVWKYAPNSSTTAFQQAVALFGRWGNPACLAVHLRIPRARDLLRKPQHSRSPRCGTTEDFHDDAQRIAQRNLGDESHSPEGPPWPSISERGNLSNRSSIFDIGLA